MSTSKARWGRNASGTLIPFVAAVLLLAYGGDIGKYFNRAEVTVWCSLAALTLFGVALARPLRLLAHPYMDMKEAWMKLMEHPIGAGLGWLGGCIVFAVLVFVLTGPARAAPPPPSPPAAAIPLLPTLHAEQEQYWPDHPDPALLAGQVEQETGPCPGRKCWSPRAELKTSREQGLGLGQFTRTARFDAAAEIRAAHPEALADYVWDNPGIYDPSLQLRAMILKLAGDYSRVPNAKTTWDRMAMALSAYNGGWGNVIKRMSMCRGSPNCDPSVWDGNLEKHPPQAKTVEAGYGQSFADINSLYPARVKKHAGKYRDWYEDYAFWQWVLKS